MKAFVPSCDKFELKISDIEVGTDEGVSEFGPAAFPQEEMFCGVLTKPIDEERLRRIYATQEPRAALLTVTDGGLHGDGCTVSLDYADRKPEEDGEICFFFIPDRSLSLVIAALQTVLNLRRAAQLERR